MRLPLLITFLSCNILLSAGDRFQPEFGISVYRSADWAGYSHFLQEQDFIRNYPSFRLKIHQNSHAWRIGLTSYKRNLDLGSESELTRGTTFYHGNLTYRHYAFFVGYEKGWTWKVFSVYGLMNLRISRLNVSGDYEWLGCFGGGTRMLNDSYDCLGITSGVGINFQPSSRFSISLESSGQLGFWSINMKEGKDRQFIYPAWIPVSALSFNFLPQW